MRSGEEGSHWWAPAGEARSHWLTPLCDDCLSVLGSSSYWLDWLVGPLDVVSMLLALPVAAYPLAVLSCSSAERPELLLGRIWWEMAGGVCWCCAVKSDCCFSYTTVSVCATYTRGERSLAHQYRGREVHITCCWGSSSTDGAELEQQGDGGSWLCSSENDVV